jgi:phosphoenolpyruvate carboxylase
VTAEVILPLTVAARRLERATERLSHLAEAESEAAFEAGVRDWHRQLRAFGAELQRATGLNSAELAERLVP